MCLLSGLSVFPCRPVDKVFIRIFKEKKCICCTFIYCIVSNGYSKVGLRLKCNSNKCFIMAYSCILLG